MCTRALDILWGFFFRIWVKQSCVRQKCCLCALVLTEQWTMLAHNCNIYSVSGQLQDYETKIRLYLVLTILTWQSISSTLLACTLVQKSTWPYSTQMGSTRRGTSWFQILLMRNDYLSDWCFMLYPRILHLNHCHQDHHNYDGKKHTIICWLPTDLPIFGLWWVIGVLQELRHLTIHTGFLRPWPDCPCLSNLFFIMP